MNEIAGCIEQMAVLHAEYDRVSEKLRSLLEKEMGTIAWAEEELKKLKSCAESNKEQERAFRDLFVKGYCETHIK